MQNLIKRKNIFLHNSNEISENLFKETKTKLLRKDTLQVIEAVIQRCCVKKVSLKMLPPVYLHIIKIAIWHWTKPCQNPDRKKNGHKMLLG